MNSTLYVITPIFNPFNFASRLRLYGHFQKAMADAGVKLVTVEAAFGDQPFRATTAGNPMHVQTRTNQIIWHKERLINLGFARLKHVIPDCRFIGWFDADISFANDNWVDETVHNLSHLSVVQPFSQAINLNAQDEFMWNCPSSIKSFLDGRGYHQEPPLPVSYTYKGHPGLAWCATREVLDACGGLYDVCIAGSADTVISNALKGDFAVYLPGHPPQPMMDSMAAYAGKLEQAVGGRIGYTRGCVLHHWHGQSGNRGYEKRWSILSFHRFDPATDLKTDDQGMLMWAGNKPKLEQDIRMSLGGRNEDER